METSQPVIVPEFAKPKQTSRLLDGSYLTSLDQINVTRDMFEFKFKLNSEIDP